MWQAQVKILEDEEQGTLELTARSNPRIRISGFPPNRWMLKKRGGSGNALLEDDNPSAVSAQSAVFLTLFLVF